MPNLLEGTRCVVAIDEDNSVIGVFETFDDFQRWKSNDYHRQRVTGRSTEVNLLLKYDR